MSLELIFDFDKNLVQDCRHRIGSTHYHSTWVLEDSDHPGDYSFVEAVCREMLAGPETQKKLSVKKNDLKDGFNRALVKEAVGYERHVIGGSFEDYALGFAEYLDSLKWARKPTEVRQFSDEDDIMITWNLSNGVKASAVHAIAGSLTKTLSDLERRQGKALFANHLNVGYKVDDSPLRVMRTIEADAEFIYSAKVFKKH